MDLAWIAMAGALAFQPPPLEATIAEVLADPEAYGDQVVRLRGQVNVCSRFDCEICPEAMTPEDYQASADDDAEQCLNMGFHPFVTEAGDGFIGAEALMEEAFRFTVVTMTATVNPTCLTHRPWPPDPAFEAEEAVVICSDRATVLWGARVEDVHRRIPSEQGLVRRDDPAIDPAPGLRDVLWSDILRALPWMVEEAPQYAAFTPQWREFREFDDEALLCVCREDDCAGAWPTRRTSVFYRTPNNPYDCYFALRTGESWRVYVD